MCGISGFLDVTHSHTGEELRNIALRMADAPRHRGQMISDLDHRIAKFE